MAHSVRMYSPETPGSGPFCVAEEGSSDYITFILMKIEHGRRLFGALSRLIP
jgi:hypothetical protein